MTILEIKHEFPCSYNPFFDKMKGLSPKKLGYDKFPSPWSQPEPSRPTSAPYRRYPQPWAHNREIDRREYPRTLAYQPRGGRSNRRRRSHLDDVFRTNYEDSEDEFSSRGNGSNTHRKYSVSKKANPPRRDNPQENKEKKSKICIKLNAKSCDKIKSKDVLSKEENKSNELSNKVSSDNNNTIDLIDEALPKTNCSTSSVQVSLDNNEKQLEEIDYEIPKQEVTIDLTEELLSTQKDESKGTDLTDGAFNMIPQENTIDLMDEPPADKVPGTEVNCTKPPSTITGETEMPKGKSSSVQDVFESNVQKKSIENEPDTSTKPDNNNDIPVSVGITKSTKDVLIKDVNANLNNNDDPTTSREKTDIVTIPFFENLSTNQTSHNDIEAARNDSKQSKNTSLTPENYLMLCESTENQNSQKKEGDEKDSDVSSPGSMEKSKEGHDDYNVVDMDISSPSSEEKSTEVHVLIDKDVASNSKIVKYPEINSQVLLQEIDKILMNDNSETSTQDVETVNSNNEASDDLPTVSSRTEECPKIDTNVEKQNDKVNQLEEIVSNRALISLLEENKYVKTKRIIDEVNKNAEVETSNKKSGCDSAAKSKNTHRRHRRRKSNKNIFSDRPYLKKFDFLFGDTEDISQETKARLQTSRKVAKVVKRKPRERSPQRVDNNKTYPKAKHSDMKQRWSESAIKQIMDNVTVAKRPLPSMREIVIVLNRAICDNPMKNQSEKNATVQKQKSKKRKRSPDESSDREDIKRRKTESSDRSTNIELQEVPFQINHGAQSELEDLDSVCSIVQQFDTFPSLCRARIDVVLNEPCDEAVTLDQPDTQQDIEIVSNIDASDDVIEIKPDIPLIDLTDNCANIEKANNLEDSKEDLLAMLKEEPKPSDNESITLYRSDQTLDDTLDLQAQSAVISESVQNINPISTDHKSEEKLFVDKSALNNVEETDQLVTQNEGVNLKDIVMAPSDAVMAPSDTVMAPSDTVRVSSNIVLASSDVNSAPSTSSGNGNSLPCNDASSNNNFISDRFRDNAPNVEPTSFSLGPPNVSIVDVMAAEMRLNEIAKEKNNVRKDLVFPPVVPVINNGQETGEIRHSDNVQTANSTPSHLVEEDHSRSNVLLANLQSDSQLIAKEVDEVASSVMQIQERAYIRNDTNLYNSTQNVISEPTNMPITAEQSMDRALVPGVIQGNQLQDNISGVSPDQIRQLLINRGKGVAPNGLLLNKVRSNNFTKELGKQVNARFPAQMSCTNQVMMNMSQLSQENNGQRSRRVSTEQQVDKTAASQTPRRESTDNSNESIRKQDAQMLQEVTNIFIRIVISCIHIRKHQLIYIQSIKELKDFVPEVVDLQIQITIKQYEETLIFLSTKLATDLKAVCKKKNIIVDTNKWFEILFKNAHMFLESFTKMMLIALLRKLMHYYKDFYLSIPYLKSLFSYIKVATEKYQELLRPNTSSMQEDQRQLLKSQIDQYHRTLAVVPQTVSVNNNSVSSPANSTTRNYCTAIQKSPNSSNFIQTNSSSLPNQNNRSLDGDKRLACKSNPVLLKGLLHQSQTNYTQNAQFTGSRINNDVQNVTNHLSKDAVKSQNAPPLNIISNVVINPGNPSGPPVQVTQKPDNFKIRLHLSTPYDSQTKGVSKTSSEEKTSNHDNSSYVTQFVNNTLGSSPQYASNIPSQSVHHPVNTSGIQRTPFHVSGAYTDFNNMEKHLVNKYLSATPVVNTSHVFKAPNPVPQERIILLDSQRMQSANDNSLQNLTNQSLRNSTIPVNRITNVGQIYSSTPRNNNSSTHYIISSPIYSPIHNQIGGGSPSRTVNVNSQAGSTPIHTVNTPTYTGSTPIYNGNTPIHSPTYTGSTPFNTGSTSIHSVNTPIHTGNTPTYTGSTPVHTGSASIHSVNTSIHTGNTPTYTGSTPIHTGRTPVHKGNTPIHSWNTPTHTGSSPIHNGNTPIHSGNTPTYTGSTPIHTGSASIRSVNTPIHTGNAKTYTGSTPIHKGNTPIHSGNTPIYTGSPPIHNGNTPIHSGNTPIHTGSMPIHNGNTSNHSGNTPTSTSIHTGSTPIHNGNTPTHSRNTPTYSGSTPIHTGSTPVHSGNTPLHAGCTPTHTGNTPNHTGSTPIHTGSTPVHAGRTPIHTGSSPAHSECTPTRKGRTPPQTGRTPSNSESTPTHKGDTPTSTGSRSSYIGSTPSQAGSTPFHQIENTPLSQTGSTPRSDCESTPDQLVPPALRNLKSPVYAPMLFSPPSYVDEGDETELTDGTESEIIDLTWMDDADPQTLQNELNDFYLKKEEFDEDEVVLNQEQFPVAHINGPLWMSPWEPSRQDPG